MRTHADRSGRKRPYNLTLNEPVVTEARRYTDNLSAVVEALLTEYVARQRAAIRDRQRVADQVAAAWNTHHARYGSFADEHSTL